MKDVERFMKHYFLIAKDVGDLTAILCAGAGGPAGQARAGARAAMMAKLRAARPPRRCPRADDFVVDNNRITIADPDVFARDPVNLIRMFHLAQKHNLVLHPDAMRAATQVAQADRRASCGDDPEANRLFLEILTSQRRRDRAAADERDRRARPLRAAPSAASSR